MTDGTSFTGARAIVARHDTWQVALDEALRGIEIEGQSGPDLLIMFASTAYAAHYPELVRAAWQRSGAGCLVGCSARGVIGGLDSRESEPGISLLALWLPGATLRPVRLHQANQDILAEPDHWFSLYDIQVEDVSGWMVFAEPFRMDVQETVVNLRSLYPRTPMIGAQASTHLPDRRLWIFLDGHVYDEGGVALALGGPYALDVIVSQGGDPVGRPWTITGVEGNRITTISNRPALDVLRETVDSFDPGSTNHPSVLIGFPMNEYQDEFVRGDFVVRGVLGVDETTGTLTVGSLPRLGQTVQFHLRDPRAASEDGAAMLSAFSGILADHHALAGLLCTCRGRGAAMFGTEDHDALTVAQAFPGLPVAGMFSFGEIGPVRGVPALNGFAMSFGVITRRA
jgi:small ligand-binding sensory domain FIST